MPRPAAHPELEALPEWPPRTVAFLATVDDEGPHAIPISAPVRDGDRRILFNLQLERGSLARLRSEPSVALLVLGEGDVAFTARGTARVIADPLAGAPEYAGVALAVAAIDDHRQAAFRLDSGVGRTWLDESEQRALGERVRALRELAAEGRRDT